MDKEKTIEIIKASDGFCVAEITENEHGKFTLWQRSRTNSAPGNNHSAINDYIDLASAQAEAKNIRIKYEQDQT